MKKITLNNDEVNKDREFFYIFGKPWQLTLFQSADDEVKDPPCFTNKTSINDWTSLSVNEADFTFEISLEFPLSTHK